MKIMSANPADASQLIVSTPIPRLSKPLNSGQPRCPVRDRRVERGEALKEREPSEERDQCDDRDLRQSNGKHPERDRENAGDDDCPQVTEEGTD